MSKLAAGRLQLLKVAGIAPSLPSPTIRRPNRPANPTTTSAGPKTAPKSSVGNPGPHVNLGAHKTSLKAINQKAAAKPKG